MANRRAVPETTDVTHSLCECREKGSLRGWVQRWFADLDGHGGKNGGGYGLFACSCNPHRIGRPW
jgi:hypothetical protein